MPVITCPKCKGKLRLPDDSPARRVKCPTCGNVFLSTDGINANDPVAGAAFNRPDPPKSRDSKVDFDLPVDDDRDRDRRRNRDEDDDDRDRGRSRRRYERDDDYERPRRSRRRDEDEDDDRYRRRRRQEEDDYDDEPRRRRRDDDRRRRREDPNAIEGQFDRASLGCFLNFIAGWLQVAAFGLVAFVVFLHWCGIQDGLGFFLVIAGLLGLGYWLTSATGLGFLVSGPRKRGAMGLSIAAASVAALHLLLIVLIATNRNWGGFGSAVGDRSAEVHWQAMVTQLHAIPSLLFAQIGVGDARRGASDGSLLPVVNNLAEIARMVLFLLTLRAIMACLRDRRGESLCMKAVIGFAVGAGALLAVGILFGLLLLAVRPSGFNRDAIEMISTVAHLYFLVLYLVLAGLAVGVNLIVRSVKGRIDYR